jgi:two-component system, NtrC family, sensor histidine kinase AtoS
MNPPAQFYTLPTIRRAPNPADFEALLDLLPHAALILDVKSKRLLLANAKATELTAYTRAELAGMDIDRLSTNPIGRFLVEKLSGDMEPLPLTLTKRNKSQVEIMASFQRLSTQGRWILASLEPAEQVQRRILEGNRRGEILMSMKIISSAFHQTDLSSAADNMLEAARHMTKAETAGIYLQELASASQDIQMQRLIFSGSIEALPDALPAQDLAHLRRPLAWTPGKRIASSLHLAARSNGLAYMATAPLGSGTATIGILAVGGREAPLQEILMPQVEILADAITALIEHHSRAANLEAELLSLTRAEAVRQLVDNTIDEAVIILDADLTLARMNLAAETTLGYSSAEAQGQPVDNILISTETLLPMLKNALEGWPTLKAENLHLYRRSGESFLAQVSVLPALIEDTVQGVIILIQDMSEKEQIQAQAQQLEQRALLGEVTAIFAHEVRNPINNISTGLQLMGYNLPEDDPNQEIIARLQSDCDRLGELMKSVLAFSRPTEYEMEAVDIGPLLNRLLDRQRSRTTTPSIQTHIQIEPGIPPVRGNARALEQVFANLITNAAQAMSDTGGSIAIKVRQIVAGEERRYVQVDVADNGPGIPKELQERIFQPFFTTKPNGTGLGLAITKRIITAHKGNIQVSSFPGGTVFHVLLPAMEGQ